MSEGSCRRKNWYIVTNNRGAVLLLSLLGLGIVSGWAILASVLMSSFNEKEIASRHPTLLPGIQKQVTTIAAQGSLIQSEDLKENISRLPDQQAVQQSPVPFHQSTQPLDPKTAAVVEPNNDIPVMYNRPKILNQLPRDAQIESEYAAAEFSNKMALVKATPESEQYRQAWVSNTEVFNEYVRTTLGEDIYMKLRGER